MDSHILKLLHHPILHLACLLCGEMHHHPFLLRASDVVVLRAQQTPQCGKRVNTSKSTGKKKISFAWLIG